MTLADTVQFWGNSYTAVAYHGRPADFLPTDDPDDPKCKICALEPNYCKLQEECNGNPPFIFVKTVFFNAMMRNQNAIP